MITARELKEKYFKFFESKGHTRIPSVSLIPENDPTVLFTTAGMHPLVPYLLGEKHPGGKRVVSAQKCVRTDDIEEVGDAVHHTFFEMLGNWSFGDPASPDGIGQGGYFKKEAITWSWEFLTGNDWLGLDKNRLAISIFAGDKDAPLDKESKSIWLKLGVPEERIAALPKKNNWWGPAGQTGPCGPDTEMFYWAGTETPPAKFDPDDSRWVEIWNDVFMEYNKTANVSYETLKQKNVDTGMGIERTLAVLNGYDDNYRTDLFWPIIKEIEKQSGRKYDESAEVRRAMRIVADHIKAAVFIIADGVTPSKTGSGYVLRRLIRRARYYYNSVGAKDKALGLFSEFVALMYQDIYPELPEKKSSIDKVITDEETTFVGHLMFGGRLLEKIIKEEKYISGDNAFLLYSTHGFPFELILDIAKENNIEVDKEGFNKKKAAHQELSRTASAGMFKGGLADHSEMSTKYHTATHLLHAALREVLGKHVLQKGSNITAERLRFDFSHSAKMTAEEIKQVEDLVNANIQADYPVGFKETTVAQAQKSGAIGLFAGKYSDKVKVYTIGYNSEAVSREICGGPHVEHTGVLGKFKIIKEEAASAGVRRIKATLE